MKRRKTFAVVFLVIVAVVLAFSSVAIYWQHLRRDWKNQAVAEIARLSSDSAWVSAQIATIRDQIDHRRKPEVNWLTSRMLLTKDGQWLVFMNHCSKQDWHISDIFIAKGSDERWYYSTFHFCIDMCGIGMYPEQPPDLASFAKTFYVREFDGQSDDALKTTWPPADRSATSN
jgi:hypothetical protein